MAPNRERILINRRKIYLQFTFEMTSYFYRFWLVLSYIRIELAVSRRRQQSCVLSCGRQLLSWARAGGGEGGRESGVSRVYKGGAARSRLSERSGLSVNMTRVRVAVVALALLGIGK